MSAPPDESAPPAPAAAAPEDEGGAGLIVLGRKGRRTADGKALRVDPCDFRNPVFLAENDLRKLRARSEEVVRNLAARFSAFLRMEFALRFVDLATMPYGRYASGLPDPAHLTLFKAMPLHGLGIVSLSPRLGLIVTDRMLGGRGEPLKDDRPLTEIETGLLEDCLRLVVEEWCRQWRDLEELRPQLVGHETNSRFLQTAPKDAAVLSLTMEVALGNKTEPLGVTIPYAAVEPMVKKIQAAAKQREAKPDDAKPALEWRAAYAGISLPAVADWKLAQVRLSEVLNLRPGDVLELPRETLTQTRIRLAERPVFVGSAGVRDGRVAVKVERRLGGGEDSDTNPSAAFSPMGGA